MNSVVSKRISLERPYLLPYSALCLKIAVSCGFQASRVLRTPLNRTGSKLRACHAQA